MGLEINEKQSYLVTYAVIQFQLIRKPKFNTAEFSFFFFYGVPGVSSQAFSYFGSLE